MIVDRKSRARFLYLISASLAALIFTIALVIVCLIRHSPSIEYGVAGGILGAFFSISIGIRSRTIRTDLHWRDNTSDAVLRVAVGMIAGFVIVCLYRLEFIDWLKFPQSLASSSWMPNFILGFLGGFAERLIPDLLSKVASGNGSAIPEQDAAVNASKNRRIQQTQPHHRSLVLLWRQHQCHMPKTTLILAFAMLNLLPARRSPSIRIYPSQQEALLAKMSRHHRRLRLRGYKLWPILLPASRCDGGGWSQGC